MLPYSKQNINDEDIESVVKILRSDYLTQGPKIQEFETKDSTDSSMEETKQTFATLTSTEAKNSFPPLDLVGAELLDLDFTMCIKATACLSECVLKFSSGHAQSLFLLKRGRVVGLLHVSDISEIGL